jgi:hypothetical protein
VQETLPINVLNRAPYLACNISSKTVGINGQLTIDPSSSFIDADGHSLTIYDAYYTINSVRSQIPDSDSFFSIVSSKMILVDPNSSSVIGIYSIDVRYTDGNLTSAFGTFNVDVTNTRPWFNRTIPAVYLNYNSASSLISLSKYFSDPTGETLTMTATYNLGANASVTIPEGIFN